MSILTPKDYEKLYNSVEAQSNVLLSETVIPKHEIYSVEIYARKLKELQGENA